MTGDLVALYFANLFESMTFNDLDELQKFFDENYDLFASMTDQQRYEAQERYLAYRQLCERF